MTIEVSVTSVLKGGTEPTGWSVKWIDSVEFSLLWWCQTENLTYSSPNSNRYVVSGSENPVIWEGSDRWLLSAAGLDRHSKYSHCFFLFLWKKKYWTRTHEFSLHPALTMRGILVLAWYLKCFSKPSFFSFTHHLPFTRQNATSLSVIQLSRLGQSPPSPTSSALFKWAEWNRAQSRSEESVVSLVSVRSITQKPKPLCTPESI